MDWRTGTAVPTVPFAIGSPATGGVQLPAVLRGHAQGYDRDVIHASTVDELVNEISVRAGAIRLPGGCRYPGRGT